MRRDLRVALVATASASVLIAGCAARPVEPAVVAPAADAAAHAPASDAAAAVAPPSSPAAASYECADGTRLRVQPEGDVLVVEGPPGGPFHLGRDAGGFTPEQTVWSGPQLRVELGLGTGGDRALVQSLYPPHTVECRRR